MHLKLNDWEIPCIAIEQLDYSLYKATTNSETAYTRTWAWLTESRIIKKSIPSFIDTKVSGEIVHDTQSPFWQKSWPNFTFDGFIEQIELHDDFYLRDRSFKTYTIIIRLDLRSTNQDPQGYCKRSTDINVIPTLPLRILRAFVDHIQRIYRRDT